MSLFYIIHSDSTHLPISPCHPISLHLNFSCTSCPSIIHNATQDHCCCLSYVLPPSLVTFQFGWINCSSGSHLSNCASPLHYAAFPALPLEHSPSLIPLSSFPQPTMFPAPPSGLPPVVSDVLHFPRKPFPCLYFRPSIAVFLFSSFTHTNPFIEWWVCSLLFSHVCTCTCVFMHPCVFSPRIYCTGYRDDKW